MRACSCVRPAGEMNRQKNHRQQHQRRMHEDLPTDIEVALYGVSVTIAGQQHKLEKQKAGDPDRSRPSEQRQHHFADHRLAAEQKESAQENRRSKCDDGIWRLSLAGDRNIYSGHGVQTARAKAYST